MKIEAVIFDMDGVILDSEPHYFELETDLFISLNLPVTRDEHISYTGMSMNNMWRKIKENHVTHLTENQLIELHQNIMVEFFENAEDLVLMPNLYELLTSLKGKYKLAVASSSSHRLIDIIMRKLNIGNFFDCLVSGEDVVNSKPDPEIFLLTAQKLGVNPGNCLVFEDSCNGAVAASRAGMKCVGFFGSNTNPQNLEAADILLENFKDFDFDMLTGKN